MTQLQIFQQNVLQLKYQEEQLATTRQWLAQNLKTMRKALRLSQTEVAKGVGVAVCMISQWEAGTRPIRFESFNKILTFFLDHTANFGKE